MQRQPLSVVSQSDDELTRLNAELNPETHAEQFICHFQDISRLQDINIQHFEAVSTILFDLDSDSCTVAWILDLCLTLESTQEFVDTVGV